MKPVVPVLQLEHGKDLPLPAYGTQHSAGMDLYCALDAPVTLNSLERTLIPTGIAFALPDGFEAQIRPRSGLALNHGLTILNSPGTIDADYRGEIKVIIVNLSKKPFVFERGMRIAQLVIAPYCRVEWDLRGHLGDSERGYSGFGSTGV